MTYAIVAMTMAILTLSAGEPVSEYPTASPDASEAQSQGVRRSAEALAVWLPRAQSLRQDTDRDAQRIRVVAALAEIGRWADAGPEWVEAAQRSATEQALAARRAQVAEAQQQHRAPPSEPRPDFRGADPVRLPGISGAACAALVALVQCDPQCPPLPDGMVPDRTMDILVRDDPDEPFRVVGAALDALFAVGGHLEAIRAVRDRWVREHDTAATGSDEVSRWNQRWREARWAYLIDVVTANAGWCWDPASTTALSELVRLDHRLQQRATDMEQLMAVGRDPASAASALLPSGRAADALDAYAKSAGPTSRGFQTLADASRGRYRQVLRQLTTLLAQQRTRAQPAADAPRLSQGEVLAVAFTAAALVDAYDPERVQRGVPPRPGRPLTRADAVLLRAELQHVIEAFDGAIEFATNNANPRIARQFTERGRAIHRAVVVLTHLVDADQSAQPQADR